MQQPYGVRFAHAEAARRHTIPLYKILTMEENMKSMAELAHQNSEGGNTWCKKHGITVLGWCHLCSAEHRQNIVQQPLSGSPEGSPKLPTQKDFLDYAVGVCGIDEGAAIKLYCWQLRAGA